MGVTLEVHDSVVSSRRERLRAALVNGSAREQGIALVVGFAFLVVAWSEGGSGPEFRAGAAIVLWLAVILGLVLGLWPRAAIPRPAIAAGLSLAALAGLTGLSISWATDNGHAFIDFVRVLAYLGLFVCVVLASSAGGARPWLVGLALGAAAIACFAVIGPAVPLEGVRELNAELATARGRLSFPVGYWNGLGLVMAMGIVLFTWLSAEGRTRLSRSLSCAAIAVAGPVLALTSSRGSLAALALGLAVLVGFGRSRPVLLVSLALGGIGSLLVLGAEILLLGAAGAGSGTGDAGPAFAAAFVALPALGAVGVGLARRALDTHLAALRPPRWIGWALVVAVAALATSGFAVVNPLDRVDSFCAVPDEAATSTELSRLASASSSGRCQYWQSGLEAFASAPVSGIGAGGFEAWWAEHHTIAQPASLSHSIFIGAAAQLGVGGLGLTVLFLALAAAAGLRAGTGRLQGSARAAALAVFAAGLFSATIDWMWELPAGFGPVVVAAALLTGPALCAPAERSRGRFGLGVACLIVGWLTVVAALLSLFGEHKVAESTRLLERGREAAAIEAADTATTLVPWSAEPYLIKAAALERRGELEAASDAIDEALERAPGDWRMWSVAAQIQAADGDVFGALTALSESNRRNPFVEPLDEGSS